jgi:hypothetical protein
MWLEFELLILQILQRGSSKKGHVIVANKQILCRNSTIPKKMGEFFLGYASPRGNLKPFNHSKKGLVMLAKNCKEIILLPNYIHYYCTIQQRKILKLDE